MSVALPQGKKILAEQAENYFFIFLHRYPATHTYQASASGKHLSFQRQPTATSEQAHRAARFQAPFSLHIHINIQIKSLLWDKQVSITLTLTPS